MTGGTTKNSGATIIHSGLQEGVLTLGTDGKAVSDGVVDYTAYLLTGKDSASVSAITKAAGTALSSAEINVIVHRYCTGTLYDIAVNDFHVITDNYTDVMGDGNASYDPTTDKLSVGAFVGNLTIVGNDTVDIELDGNLAALVIRHHGFFIVSHRSLSLYCYYFFN